MNISVMIPSFNEEKNISILLPELKEFLKKTGAESEITVIDAIDSTDNTKTVCDLYDVSYIRQTAHGYADAFKCGINSAKYELFLVVDADNSQDISKIPEMYKMMCNGADVVIGSRYTKGGKTSDSTVSIIMSRILNITYRILLGFNEKDISTDFRFYKTEQLLSIHPECKNFDVIEEVLFLLKRKYPNLKTAEVPIEYKKRLEGVSKRKLFTFIVSYIILLIRSIRIRKRG